MIEYRAYVWRRRERGLVIESDRESGTERKKILGADLCVYPIILLLTIRKRGGSLHSTLACVMLWNLLESDSRRRVRGLSETSISKSVTFKLENHYYTESFIV